MELTTSEEVHVLCLFPTLEDALNFDSYVYSKLMKIENQEAIFGHQYQINERDEKIASEQYLLINATEIPFSEVYDLVKDYNGIMIPAHIDKMANSLLSNLGFIPDDSHFTCVELKNMTNLHGIQKQHPYVKSCRIITDSDAHGLMQLNEAVNTIHVEENTIPSILKALVTPPISNS
jgi:PHP family Zn ribbon phosphoesterase